MRCRRRIEKGRATGILFGLRTIRRFVVGVLRPSRIKYPMAVEESALLSDFRELIKEYRREYAERLR